MMAFQPSRNRPRNPQSASLESLEPRQLMSGLQTSLSGLCGSFGTSQKGPTTTVQNPTTSTSSTSSSTSSNTGSSVTCPAPFSILDGNTILFSQAPAAVQTGLNTLASTTLDPSQKVFLNNVGGVESYSVTLTSPGTINHYTVDVSGNPVSAPTTSTIDFSTLTTTDAAAATAITNLATALNLAAPTDTTRVFVVTTNGNSTYSVSLRTAGSGFRSFLRATDITVDASGNPVGDDLKLPFNILPTAIQNGLIADEPSGVTLDPTTTTQSVFIDTFDGVPTYSMVFTSGTTRTTITVDANGNTVKLPSRSTSTFSAIPAAAQTEIQTLATADGVTTTIDPTQNVFVFTETTGTTVYTARLTTSAGKHVTISVDQDGNPTVPPRDDDDWAGRFGIGR